MNIGSANLSCMNTKSVRILAITPGVYLYMYVYMYLRIYKLAKQVTTSLCVHVLVVMGCGLFDEYT